MLESLRDLPYKRLQSLHLVPLCRFSLWLLLFVVGGKRLLLGVEVLGCKWSRQLSVLSTKGGRLGQKPGDNYVDSGKPWVLCFDYEFGILETVRDGLQFEDYVYRLKLSVLVEEDLRLKNPIEIHKVH